MAIFDYSANSPGVADFLIGMVPLVIGALAAVTLWRRQNPNEAAEHVIGA